jgi:hypothetical protein
MKATTIVAMLIDVINLEWELDEARVRTVAPDGRLLTLSERLALDNRPGRSFRADGYCAPYTTA